MCTIVLAWQVFPDAPIAVAANRDERLGRPSSPPTRWDREPSFVAPMDEEAGGTWMGVNDHDLFVGLSNRWVEWEAENPRSRGLLVTDVLGSRSVEAAVERATDAVRTAPHAGFNLLLADPSAAVLLEFDGDLHRTNLDPGVHVLVNTGADGDYDIPAHRADLAREQAANADHVREALEPRDGETPARWLERGKAVLGDHEYGVCIHGDGYGTVSTSLISVGVDGTLTYRYADGPPCRTDVKLIDIEDARGRED